MVVLIFVFKFFSDTLRGVITNSNVYWDIESIERFFENKYVGVFLDNYTTTTFDQLTAQQACQETPHLLIAHEELLNLIKLFPIKSQKTLILYDLLVHDLLFVKIVKNSSEVMKLKLTGSTNNRAIRFERFIKVAQFKIKELELGTQSINDKNLEDEELESEDFEFEAM